VRSKEVLAERIRAIDASLAAGRASPEIAARELVRDGQMMMAEFKLTLLGDSGVRSFLVRLLERHGIRLGTRARQRAAIYAVAPDVFTREVLAPAIVDFQRAIDEYTKSALAEALSEIQSEGTDVSTNESKTGGA
jgi:hypothetical protein